MPGSSKPSKISTGPSGRPVAGSTRTISMASSMILSVWCDRPVVSVSSTSTLSVCAGLCEAMGAGPKSVTGTRRRKTRKSGSCSSRCAMDSRLRGVAAETGAARGGSGGAGASNSKLDWDIGQAYPLHELYTRDLQVNPHRPSIRAPPPQAILFNDAPRPVPAHARGCAGAHRRRATGRLRTQPQRHRRRRDATLALHHTRLRQPARGAGRRGRAAPAACAAQVRVRARLARVLSPCVAPPRTRHPGLAARRSAARARLRHRGAGRHPPGAHRCAGDRHGGAHALRHRLFAQPRPHVAGELRGAPWCRTCSTATSPATT